MTTSASYWRQSIEQGYALWDFKGTELKKEVLDQFKQVLWRPRPRTLLSREDQKRVRRTLRDYSKIFDEEDEAADASLALAHREEYQRRMAEWREWRAAARKKLADARAEAGIAALPARGTSTEHTAEVQEWIEEVLEEKEETLP